MAEAQKGKYIEAVGRRKTSTARVRMTPASKTSVTVNGKTFEDYFTVALHRQLALEPLMVSGVAEKYSISIKAVGGGVAGQVGAIRQGIARALLISDKNLKSELSKGKMLTRDSRSKERRKFGLKKARKAPQWSKR